MTVALDQIQPPAKSLLFDDSLTHKLRSLAELPTVRVETFGYSHEGRPLQCLLVATPDTLQRLPYHEMLNRQMAGPRLTFRTLEDASVQTTDPCELMGDAKVTVMLVGGSFGFEAAHVEALIALAEQLATSSDPRTTRILARLLVIVMPLMNPDGRAAAIRDWEHAPLSDGHHGSGNAYGFLINRDFFNLSQPETQSVRAVMNRFHPVAAYDPHEDMYYLGNTLPYVCWTPPFARPYHPEIDPRTLECITYLGSAIAEEWKRRGINYLYHPAGDHGFLTLFRLGGRFHLLSCLQGVSALITESARIPGTQTWADRIEQKVTAGMAFLDEIATRPEIYVKARYAVRSGLAQRDAFILPLSGNAPGTLRAIIEPLLRHEVLVYSTDVPEPAYVIPSNQPDGRLVRALLTAAPWNHVALPPMVGAACLRLTALSSLRQEEWRHAPLARVLEAPAQYRTERSGVGPPVAFPNEVEGIIVANRALNHGAKVSRGPDGSIEIAAQLRGVISHSIAGLPLNLLRKTSTLDRKLVRRPRIALYKGQGVDQRHHVLEGGIRWALEHLAFPYVHIETDEVREGRLVDYDVLIVSGGWAKEIVSGWEDPGPRWQLPGKPNGLGKQGLEAIRSFVQTGGRYLGVGSGGGILAVAPYLDVIDAEVVDEMLGEARAYIRIVQDHPMVTGVPHFIDETGLRVRDWITVPYFSEPYADVHGGPIFKAGRSVQVLAEYTAIDDPKGIREASYFKAELHTPAILYQSVGRGWAVIFAFEPALRGVWRSTFPLLANVLFFAGDSDGMKT